MESSNSTPVQLSEGFQARYASDLKFDRLSVQLSMLPDLLQTANEQHQLRIKVTTISTVCQLMNICSFAKAMLSEVDRIYLTVPMSSATAERTFSALRRPKKLLMDNYDPKETKSCCITPHTQATK